MVLKGVFLYVIGKVYLYLGSYTQMQTVPWLLDTKRQ